MKKEHLAETNGPIARYYRKQVSNPEEAQAIYHRLYELGIAALYPFVMAVSTAHLLKDIKDMLGTGTNTRTGNTRKR